MATTFGLKYRVMSQAHAVPVCRAQSASTRASTSASTNQSAARSADVGRRPRSPPCIYLECSPPDDYPPDLVRKSEFAFSCRGIDYDLRDLRGNLKQIHRVFSHLPIGADKNELSYVDDYSVAKDFEEWYFNYKQNSDITHVAESGRSAERGC